MEETERRREEGKWKGIGEELLERIPMAKN